MPYLFLRDFKRGMDRTRPQAVGANGGLWTLKNGHITRGGDIEGRKKFVDTYTLPAGTFGLAQIRGQLFAFGSDNLVASMPVGVQYQRLQAPSAPNMAAILDVKANDGALYVIAEFDDGNVYHFYDGTRVTDWDTLSANVASFTTLAEALADKIDTNAAVSAVAFGSTVTLTARVPGTAFTSAKSTVDGGGTNDQDITLTEVQANVAAAAEVRASATITITGGSSGPGINRVTTVLVDSVPLIASAVDWVASNNATATALAAAISAGEATHGYSAIAAGAVVTLTENSVADPSSVNGDIVAVGVGGDVTISKTNVSGGAAAVAAVAQVVTADISGTEQAADRFTITVNGTGYTSTPRASGAGTSAFTHKTRQWSTAGSLLAYSQLADASDWTDVNASSGAGQINVASQTDGSERIVACAPFDRLVAVFARDTIHIYNFDTDAQNISYVQPVTNTGTRAPRSPLAYGNNEVFYLDDTGVRSLRAKASTDAPFATDIGSPIDPFVKEYLATLTGDQVRKAVSQIEPEDGRYWLAVGRYIFVLSYFPSNKIEAWSYYDVADDIGADVTDVVKARGSIFVRAGNTVYAYGGIDGTVYPDAGDSETVAETPFLDAESPANKKTLHHFDTSVQGDWYFKILTEPADTLKGVDIGQISTTTYNNEDIDMPGKAGILAVKAVSTSTGRRLLSSATVHYDGGKPQ